MLTNLHLFHVAKILLLSESKILSRKVCPSKVVKKDQPCLTSPDKFVIWSVQIKNYNLCYLRRNKFLSKCASIPVRKVLAGDAKRYLNIKTV